MKNPNQITVTLSADMIRDIKKEASEKNISNASMLRYIVSFYFENKQQNQYKKILDELNYIKHRI